MELTRELTEQEAREQQQTETVQQPDKAAYLERIKALPAEDQAFLDGFLFAKVTSERRRA